MVQAHLLCVHSDAGNTYYINLNTSQVYIIGNTVYVDTPRQLLSFHADAQQLSHLRAKIALHVACAVKLRENAVHIDGVEQLAPFESFALEFDTAGTHGGGSDV